MNSPLSENGFVIFLKITRNGGRVLFPLTGSCLFSPSCPSSPSCTFSPSFPVGSSSSMSRVRTSPGGSGEVMFEPKLPRLTGLGTLIKGIGGSSSLLSARVTVDRIFRNDSAPALSLCPRNTVRFADSSGIGRKGRGGVCLGWYLRSF